MPAGARTNTLHGDAHTLTESRGGNDRVVGGGSNRDELYGDGFRLISSKGGNDVLTAATSVSNFLYGDAFEMLDSSRGGNDILRGASAGGNTLVGDASIGEAGVRGGNDRLVSAAGTADRMWGDFQERAGTGGRDRFVFGEGNGQDSIFDFERTHDLIELRGIEGVESFADLDIQTVDTNNDNTLDSSVIGFGDNNSVTVYNVTNLAARDFLFHA